MGREWLTELADLIAAQALNRRNVVSLTPRRVKKLMRSAGLRPKSPRDVREVMDMVLARVSASRKVVVKKSGNGSRVIFILPPGVDSPYLG